MVRTVCGALCAVALLAGSASADFQYWRIRSGPGAIRALAVDPTNGNVVWAARSNAGTIPGDFGVPYGAGIARSTDGGATFFTRSTGLTNLHTTSIAIDPSSPSTLYVGTKGGGVFRTTDAGLSWTPRNVGLGSVGVYSLAIDPQTPTTIYAGMLAGGIYRSTDAGATWTVTSGGGGLTIWEMAVDPTTPTTIYAATNGGVRKSVDGGATWTGTGTFTVQDEHGPPRQVGDVRSVLIDAVSPSTIYAGLHDAAGVFKSTDGGATWVHASTGLLSQYGNYRFVHRLAQDPTTPTVLYATTTRATYRSIDGAATWAVFEAGMSRGEAYALATTSTGGAFVASTFGDVHALATRTSGVDHFRCLRAKGRFVPRTVTVDDRFGTQQVTLLKPYRLCVPTSVSGEPIVDPTTLLACYRVRGKSFPSIFIPFLTNRLDGYRAFDINRADNVCVPANVVGVPSAQPRDAYRCMAGPHWTSDALDLQLSDAFGGQAVRDSRLDRLCGPTSIDGAPRLEPGVSLRCDKLVGPKTAPAPSTVTIEDQFGTLALTLQRADSHCVQVLDSRN